MMKNCPICASQLETIDVAPCFDCGHRPSELEHFTNVEHEYHVFELWGQEITLCDFCDVDFGSYFPQYWGLPEGPLPDYPLKLLRKVWEPRIEKDLFCANCDHRMRFLLFRVHAIAHNVG